MALPALSAEALVAHRGWPGRYPENSIAGSAAAISAGARYVEVDVQLTRDGVPVVIHDAELARISGHSGSVLELLAGALPGIDVGEHHRLGGHDRETALPTLEAVLALIEPHPAVTAFIELKSESAQRFGREAVLEAVTAVLGPASRHVLIGADEALIEGARAIAGTAVGWITPALGGGHERTAHELAPDYLFCCDAVVPDEGEPF
jgi:glycerophosphoryl diester phosphodiesterase